MRGDLESEASILVKGKVIGNISCKTLIIDRDARVDGSVEATEVIVRGKIKGTITADRISETGMDKRPTPTSTGVLSG